MEKKGQEVKVFSIADIKLNNLPKADIYILSSPVRMFLFPLKMRGFLKRFKPPNLNSKICPYDHLCCTRTISFRKNG
jgi:multimeric flavodoxin WrbA